MSINFITESEEKLIDEIISNVSILNNYIEELDPMYDEQKKIYNMWVLHKKDYLWRNLVSLNYRILQHVENIYNYTNFLKEQNSKFFTKFGINLLCIYDKTIISKQHKALSIYEFTKYNDGKYFSENPDNKNAFLQKFNVNIDKFKDDYNITYHMILTEIQSRIDYDDSINNIIHYSTLVKKDYEEASKHLIITNMDNLYHKINNNTTYIRYLNEKIKLYYTKTYNPSSEPSTIGFLTGNYNKSFIMYVLNEIRKLDAILILYTILNNFEELKKTKRLLSMVDRDTELSKSQKKDKKNEYENSIKIYEGNIISKITILMQKYNIKNLDDYDKSQITYILKQINKDNDMRELIRNQISPKITYNETSTKGRAMKYTDILINNFNVLLQNKTTTEIDELEKYIKEYINAATPIVNK